MKPSVRVTRLAWWLIGLIAAPSLAEPLIPPTAIDWLLDCPLPAVARLDPEVLERTQCGVVSVPRDHAAPARGRIRLVLTRVGARQPLNREGVVFAQSGEPHHGKNTPFALQLASRWESYATPAYRALTNLYDVIELTPRDLRQAQGVEQAALDMEFVRTQLGEARLNFVGNADATRLGSRYGALFPERVARMVLVNASHGDPITSGIEHLLLKAPPAPSKLANGCVERWLGDFLMYGKQPPPSARCVDSGQWE
ncbi:alpha/beta hydrolase [Pseudomonas sp. BIGb0164]|uniref:alpha/beta hydrolase n=1 Tax=Pseudomonas sp. BIGb0164 TaxID=2940605 RepID=UPI00216A4FC1|nr:alpha/beta hydrolase [Pseudomonas sp. BIGb0164]MCS4251256.1 hypothetical protein [Pseudomonas sp. BIGb0164]